MGMVEYKGGMYSDFNTKKFISMLKVEVEIMWSAQIL